MRLCGVGRRYGLRGAWVLRGVDLEVPPGSLIRVRGSNGSGKSTLLRLLAGIDAPTTGRITARPPTAYVPERFPADLPFTALDYLTHLGRLHGLDRAAAARGAEEWLGRFDAAGFARTPLAELSKGTSQKVAVAQALLAAPGLLVLDEAWTGLDEAARATLDEAVISHVTAGATVVYVDHDPRRLASSVDQVLHITDTRLVPARDASAAPLPSDPPLGVAGPDVADGPPGAGGRMVPGPRGPGESSAGAMSADARTDGRAWGSGAGGAPSGDRPVDSGPRGLGERGPGGAPPVGRPVSDGPRGLGEPGSVPGAPAQAGAVRESVPGTLPDGAVPGPGPEGAPSPGGRVAPSPPGPGEPGPAAMCDGSAGEVRRRAGSWHAPPRGRASGAEARICVEVEGPPGAAVPDDLPGAPVAEPGRGGVGPVVRLTVAAAHSDALLRALLTARPPWHIRAVTPVAAGEKRAPGHGPDQAVGGGPQGRTGRGSGAGRAPVRWPAGSGAGGAPAPRRAGAGAGGRALPALLRYQAALLARSQRWVAPVVLYGAFMGIGVMAGQPILDSFGYAAAALLPIAAWLVRVCVGNEPSAARDCAAAVAGPARVHLSSVLTGLSAAAGLGVVGALFVALVSDPKTSDQRIDVSRWEAAAAGLLAALTCALLGAAIGALFSRPLLLSTGWGVQATAIASLLVLVVSASPANAAVSGLVSGSNTGVVTLPLLPLAMTGAAAAGATALACALSSRRSS